MNILFLYPIPSPKATVINYLRYNQGIGVLISLLKQKGHSVTLKQMWKVERDAIDRAVKKHSIDLALVSSTSDQYPVARDLIDYCHRKHGLKSILGGVHATIASESCVDQEGLLALCQGEGEGMLMETVARLENNEPLDGIRNLWMRRPDGSIERNPQRAFEDLDALPFPDREAFDFQRILDSSFGAEMIGGRGCPYRCTFCVDPVYKAMNKGNGKYTRFRKVDSVLEECESILARYDNTYTFLFLDEIFTLKKAWLAEFTEKYAARVKVPFRCNARVDCVDDETLSMLKKAKCNLVCYGIEAGNDRLRNMALEKETSAETIIEAFRKTREHGIKTLAFNMVGLPTETKEMVEETIALNRRARPDILFVSVFRPYPGTGLYEMCEKNGWISDRKVESYFDNSTILDQPSISRKEVAYYFNIFPWEVMFPRLAPFLRPLMKAIYTDKVNIVSLYNFIVPIVKKLYRLRVVTFERRFFKWTAAG